VSDEEPAGVQASRAKANVCGSYFGDCLGHSSLSTSSGCALVRQAQPTVLLPKGEVLDRKGCESRRHGSNPRAFRLLSEKEQQCCCCVKIIKIYLIYIYILSKDVG